MRRADAPAPGWFPDPQHRAKLRWWDGTDWSDIRRAVPSGAEVTAYADLLQEAAVSAPGNPAGAYIGVSPEQISGLTNFDSQRMVDDFRTATRGEVARAADVFEQRADQMVRRYSPLVSEYSNRFIRFLRFAAIVATILFVGWLVLNVVAQASFFDWIGDRIDNITEDSSAQSPFP